MTDVNLTGPAGRMQDNEPLMRALSKVRLSLSLSLSLFFFKRTLANPISAPTVDLSESTRQDHFRWRSTGR